MAAAKADTGRQAGCDARTMPDRWVGGPGRSEYCPSRDQHALTPFDRRVYRAIACYAPDEPECCPSQRLIALDLGCCRESVNRSVGRLIRAGWLRIKARRWSFRSGWLHNVYELLEPFAVSELAMKRLTRRAHRRARRKARERRIRRFGGDDHTNPKGWCDCRVCRVDLAHIRQPPPPLRPPPDERALRRADLEWRMWDEIKRARVRHAAWREDYRARMDAVAEAFA